MEARPARRAAVRLAAAFLGVAFAAGCVVATVVLATWGRGEAPALPDPSPATALVAEPTVETTPWDAEPLDGTWPASGSAGLAWSSPTPPPTPTAYGGATPAIEPPLAYQPPPVSVTPAPRTENVAAAAQHPVAFGPPEDDSIPAAPSLAPPQSDSEPLLADSDLEPVSDNQEASFGPSFRLPPIGDDPDEPFADFTGPAASDTRRGRTRVGLRTLGAEDGALTPFTASVDGLSKRLEPQVRSGFQLGKAGAVYAARGEFVAVLRRVAAAKDAAAGGTRHADALADGLRTLDDADDFVPRGDALEAELDVAAIARSHGVDLGDGVSSPHEAVARYARHASQRLAEAAGGEPAASMALYGLGKTYARVEAQFADPAAGRKAIVMYRSAVATHRENFLAANELGVHLARGGHYEAARQALQEAAAQPGAIAAVHQNLAAIENRLGSGSAANVAASRAVQLAQQERVAGAASERHGVTWVAPQAFSGSAPGRTAALPTQPATPAPTPAPSRGGWAGFVDAAKRATGWSSTPEPVSAPTPQPGYAGPVAAYPAQRQASVQKPAPAPRQAAVSMQRAIR